MLIAEVMVAGRSRGSLEIAVPAKMRQEGQTLLDLAARLVALRLPPDQEGRRHLLDLVTVGEAAGWLVHAINNHLNGMVLQAACVQMQTQPPARDQAEQIRREGGRAAARLRPLQALRPWPAREGERVDLVAAIHQVLGDEPALARVRSQLAREEILVSASVMGMRRLLTLLFHVVLRCVGSKEKVVVKAGRVGSQPELVLHLPGVRLEPGSEGIESLPAEEEGGLRQLEREAARWLVRQTGGQIVVVQGETGATLTVRWESR